MEEMVAEGGAIAIALTWSGCRRSLPSSSVPSFVAGLEVFVVMIWVGGVGAPFPTLLMLRNIATRSLGHSAFPGCYCDRENRFLGWSGPFATAPGFGG
jgi:hypothetical protein